MGKMDPNYPLILDKRVIFNSRSHVLNDLVITERFHNKNLAVFEKAIFKNDLKLKTTLYLKNDISLEDTIANTLKESKSYTDEKINMITNGASESFDTLLEIQEQIKLDGTLDTLIQLNKLTIEENTLKITNEQ